MSNNVLDEIEAALEATEAFLPSILAVVGTFYPPAAALGKFLPLIGVAIQGVQTVEQATGTASTSVAQATTPVINTLTPGAPNAPALTGPAPAPAAS